MATATVTTSNDEFRFHRAVRGYQHTPSAWQYTGIEWPLFSLALPQHSPSQFAVSLGLFPYRVVGQY